MRDLTIDAGRLARFKATDANGNGWVSKDEYVSEYQARLERQLAPADLDAEKRDEDRQRQIRQTHVRFGLLEQDTDKRMTKAEYDASGTRAFAARDDDKDGVVTAVDTMATAAPRHAPQETAPQ